MDHSSKMTTSSIESTDVLQPRTVHRFMDLPLEIRHIVYREYMQDNPYAAFSEEWPQIDLNFCRDGKPKWNPNLATYYKLPRSYFYEALPILPAICLVNGTVEAEVTRFFLIIAEFKVTRSNGRAFEDSDSPSFLDKYASLLRILGVYLGDPIPHLIFPDFNHIGNSEVTEKNFVEPTPDFYIHDPALKRAKKCNAANSKLLLCSYFRKVQRLRMVFSAPTVDDEEYMWPIDDFLQDFAPKSVLQLTELRRVTVVAKSANKEEDEPHYHYRRSRYPYSSVDDGKLEHLQATVGLARQLKDGFLAEDRKVAVQVRLRHIRKCEEQVLE